MCNFFNLKKQSIEIKNKWFILRDGPLVKLSNFALLNSSELAVLYNYQRQKQHTHTHTTSFINFCPPRSEISIIYHFHHNFCHFNCYLPE